MRVAGIVGLTLVALAGCGGADSDVDTLTVFATSSLTEVFARLESEFEAANTDLDVVVSNAASSELARQIIEGAPADVFAAADLVNMDRVSDQIDGSPIVFATNRLQIVTEPGNPRGVTSLDDLADPSLLFVTSDRRVPIGGYTETVLQRAGVSVRPVSYEENVKAILNKVATGEADVGIVFVTDVLAAGSRVTGVVIPDEANVVAQYPMARLNSSDGARRFVDFVTSSTGRAILGEFGFGAP